MFFLNTHILYTTYYYTTTTTTTTITTVDVADAGRLSFRWNIDTERRGTLE